MLPFSIQLQPGRSVFKQLVEAFHRALASGQLRDGDSFPSVRTISRELKISPTTAHKVVAHLKDRGFLVSLPGVGMQVAAPNLPDKEERLRLMEADAISLIQRARDLKLSSDELNTLIRRLADEEETSTD
ncbi:MAG: GntR family transcriptional regulator [Verrucomicrobiota bacterium]